MSALSMSTNVAPGRMYRLKPACMTRELPLAKTSARDVAFAILAGIEAAQEDIFPDSFAVDFGQQFAASPKASERQMAAMTVAMLSTSSAA